MKRGFTAQEMPYLALRTITGQKKPFWLIDLSIVLGVIALIIASVVTLFFFVKAGHVEAAAEIHQNDYYCERIKEGSVRVLNPEGSLAELCASWGVTL